MAGRDKRSAVKSILRFVLLLIILTTVTTVIRWNLPRWAFPFDPFLIATVTVALNKRPMPAQLFGLAAGLSRDAFTSSIIGLYGLALTTIAIVASSLKEAVLINNVWQQGLTFALATVAQVLIIAATDSLFSLPHQIHWGQVSLDVLFNTIAGMLVIYTMRRIRKGRIRIGDYEE